MRRVSRNVGQVWVPKAGWVRFRWSRAVPPGVKSYRVTMDRAGRWHVAFAVIPAPVPAPGNGQVVGIDRGVAVSAALSTGELLHCPALTARERTRLRRLQRKLARARRGSNRRGAGQARDRPAAGPGDGPAQGLGREDQHRHRAAVRRDPGRGPADHEHDPVRERHPGEPGPERPRQGRAEPGDPAVGVGAAGAPAGRTRPRAGWRRSGPRSRASGARRAGRWTGSRVRAKPCSGALPAVSPQRGCERGHQHRGGARRDCAGRRRGSPAREPRTSTAAPIGVVAGIPRPSGGGGCQVPNHA